MNTIEKLGKMLRGGEISCVELTKLYIDASKKRNRELNAYVMLTEEAAYAAAEKADGIFRDSAEDVPPLTGIPFVLKDNIATRGLKTSCASKMLENYAPVYDASVWTYLQNENAVLLGKGNMDEFAMGSTGETSYYGGALNPHDLTRVAGGSSGGCASAVAGGLAAFGIGSDTGGSVRQPASFCGLVGLKPTYGAVSRCGLIAFASSLDQIGPITASVRDAALVFDAICHKDNSDMTCKGAEKVSGRLNPDIRGMKIGIAREFFESLAPDAEGVLESALKTLEAMGAELVTVEFPLLRHSLGAYYILACAEASSNLGRYDGLRYGFSARNGPDLEECICRTRSEGFGGEVRRRILLGTCVLSTGYYDAYYGKALALRNAVRNDYKRAFGVCDCLVTPTVPMTALPRGAGLDAETYQSDICTVTVNLAGLPAVSVPCGFGTGGLPVGMQFIGDFFREDVILSAALAFETETAGAFLRQAEGGVDL